MKRPRAMRRFASALAIVTALSAAYVVSCSLRNFDDIPFPGDDASAHLDTGAPNDAHLFDTGNDADGGLVDAAATCDADLASEPRIRVVFWVDKPCVPTEIEAAFHTHFEEVIARLRRTRRRRRRTGQVALVLGVALVIALLSIAQFVARALPGSLGGGLKEGLVIFSWVVLWRPVETLIYDWIPARHERKVATKLLDAPIEVRPAGAVAKGAKRESV